MKRKGIFQALSRLLILSMLLGLFPVMALAEDSYTYNISATTTNGTGSGSVTFYYTVGTDTSTTSETYTIGKDVYTITADSEIKSLTFQFEAANGSVFAGATYSAGLNDDDENAQKYTKTGTLTNGGSIPFPLFEDYPINSYTIKITATFNKQSSSSGSSSSDTPTTTVSTPSTGSGESVVTIQTRPNSLADIANATITDQELNSAVDAAISEADKRDTAPVVLINVRTSDRNTGLNLKLPTAGLKTLGAEKDAILRITSGIADIVMDSTVLTSIGKQGRSDINVAVEQARLGRLPAAQRETLGGMKLYNFSITSGTRNITSFDGGTLTLSVPYTLPKGIKDTDVVVFYVPDTAILEACETSYAGGKATWKTNHLSLYAVGDTSMAPKTSVLDKFTDLNSKAWYVDAVQYAVDNKLMTGVTDTLFKPDDNTSRAMMVMVLYRLSGSPAASASGFADVPANAWFADAIGWASANGIVKGYDSTTFGPDDPITREQMSTMLYRYAGFKGYSTSETVELDAFGDAAQVSAYAVPAMKWATAIELVTGRATDTLAPGILTNRAEMATILMRFCQNVVK